MNGKCRIYTGRGVAWIWNNAGLSAHTQKRKRNRTKCACKSAHFGNINLSVLVSVMLEIPCGGAELTKLPDARADERHHENKMVWWLIQGLKIGQKKPRSTWCPTSVG